MSDFIDIGPECFTDKASTVISYKGENYYRDCGAPVEKGADGSMSHCVKRANHNSTYHEDYHGKTIEVM